MSVPDLIASVFVTPLGVAYILTLSRLRYSIRTTVISASIFLALFTVLNFFLAWKELPLLETHPYLDILYRTFNVLMPTPLVLTLVRQRMGQTLFVVLLVCNIILILNTLTFVVQYLTGWPQLLPGAVLFLATAGSFRLIRRPFLAVATYFRRYWIPLSLLLAVMVAAFFLEISYPVPLQYAPQHIPMALVLCGLCILMLVVIYLLFRGSKRQIDLEQSELSMRLYVTTLEAQNELALQTAHRVSVFRHDLRHLSQMIAVCLDAGDIEGARKLFATIDESVGSALGVRNILPVTGHKLLDAALAFYILRAQEANVDIDVRMATPSLPEDMKTELAVVLANALENATNACRKLPEEKPRTIRLRGQLHGKQYFLEVVNTCVPDEINFDVETGLPVTRQEGHGLGTQNIAQFAARHGGTAEFLLEDDLFCLRLLV